MQKITGRPSPCLVPTVLCLLAGSFFPVGADDPPPVVATLEKQWGMETVETIRKEFYKRDSELYDDATDLSGKSKGPTAMWGCGVQLSALNSATKLDSSYAGKAQSYAQALDHYWIIFNDIGGYNPGTGNINSSSDRYYDDNEWIVLDLADLYELTGSAERLRKAQDTMKFVLSGEDDKLDGGIYWHEPQKESKNTCSNAPAIASLVRLYMLTGDQADLDEALRLYTWINSKLQDPGDGLFYDNIKLDGHVDKMKLTYNTALMIRSNCLLYLATGRDLYLTEAKRLGEESIRHWVDRDTGAVKDAGKFSHLLLDAFIELNNDDPGNSLWLKTVDRTVAYVHDHLKDKNGHYPEGWDHPLSSDPLEKWTLIDQASVARAYLAAAGAYRPPAPN